MADDIPYDRTPPQSGGGPAQVSPLIRRLVAPNPGPFTFTGTCGYIVGHGEVVVIDPGPALPAQTQALLAATAGEHIAAILVTHTHKDHSPGAAALKAATGAPIVGCAPHVASRALAQGETNALEGSNDHAYAPDRVLADGEMFEAAGLAFEAVATPGHTANHLAFAFPAENALFSGDHVMAWSTSIVAPPDGDMGAYMASLDRLRGRDEAVYWPGHGGPVTEPRRFLRALVHHRRQREGSILARLEAGDATIPAIVERSYEGIDPRLKGAAALSVFAHLEDLMRRGLVIAEGTGMGARFRLAEQAT